MPYLLPDEIDPPRFSVCVPVPDDPAHRRAFLGQIWELSNYWNWDKDPTKQKAAQVGRVWQEIYYIVTQRIDNGELCDGGGMDCCDNLQLQINQIIEYNNGQTNQQRENAYDGSPGSINPLAPDGNITDGTDPDRTTALCLAVQRYVGQILYLRVTGQCAVDVAAAILGVVGGFLIGGPVGAVVGGVVVGAAVHQCLDLAAALEDEDARNEAICRIVQAFEGVPLTLANFQAVWPLVESADSDAQIIIDEVAQFSNRLANYLFFIDLLGAAYDQAQAGVEADCGCPDDCGVFDFTRYGYNGTFLDWGFAEPAGSRIPGEGLANSTLYSNSSGGLYALQYDIPIDCGEFPGQIYFRATVRKATSANGLMDLGVRSMPGGSITRTGAIIALGAAPGTYVITANITSTVDFPTNLVMRTINTTAQNGFFWEDVELSDTPF